MQVRVVRGRCSQAGKWWRKKLRQNSYDNHSICRRIVFLSLHQLERFLLADVLLPAGRPGVLRTAGPLLSPPPPL